MFSLTCLGMSGIQLSSELMKEVSELSQGGAHEEEPETLSIDFISDSSVSGSITFNAPSMPGEYRLFVYVYDV